MRLYLLTCAAAVAALAPAVHADVIFQDGVFTSANWPAAQMLTPGTSPSSQLLSGGNPNECLQITDNVPAGSPHFSATGAAIRFGLVTYNSTGSDGTAFSTVADYDNFSIHLVPAPGTLALAGLAALGFRRRR